MVGLLVWPWGETSGSMRIRLRWRTHCERSSSTAEKCITHSTWSSHNSYSRQRVLLVRQPVSGVVGLIKPLRGSLLVVNFKTYLEATGKRAIDLARSAEKRSEEHTSELQSHGLI